MDWGGKLVGGAVGLLVGGPVGAALGVLAGHLLDDKLAETRRGVRRNGESARKTPQSAPPPAARKPGASSTVYHVEDTDPRVATAAGTAAEDGEDGPAVGNPEAVSARFFKTTFEVMGHVAKSDGRISEDDIRAARSIMADFAFDEPQVARAIDNYNAGKSERYEVEREVLALRRVCAGRPDLLRNFLEIQMRAAIGGSDLRGPARPMLTRIAAVLGVGGLEFAQLENVLRIRYRARGNRGDAADWNRPAADTHRSARGSQAGAGPSVDPAANRGPRPGERKSERAGERAGERGSARAGGSESRSGRAGHSRRGRTGTGEQRSNANNRGPSQSGARMSLQEAYQVLDVLPGARMPEITKAYRRQLSRHHPDKLKANGLPESMLAHAQQQTQLIIEAFNIIRESRGEKA